MGVVVVDESAQPGDKAQQTREFRRVAAVSAVCMVGIVLIFIFDHSSNAIIWVFVLIFLSGGNAVFTVMRSARRRQAALQQQD